MGRSFTLAFRQLDHDREEVTGHLRVFESIGMTPGGVNRCRADYNYNYNCNCENATLGRLVKGSRAIVGAVQQPIGQGGPIHQQAMDQLQLFRVFMVSLQGLVTQVG